jgi:lipoprotein-anchoring transpeptidase ErfK/SrfK
MGLEGRALVALVAGVVAIANLTCTSSRATETPGLHLEVSLSKRRLYEFDGGELVRSFRVAVGKPGHETPTGRFTIAQIDWNPDWTPPDEDWTADEPYRPPGHAANPMGRVRIQFDPPYTIHGTDALDSLGRAASHGSIRMKNEEAMDLARRLMERAGVDKSDGWFERIVAEPTRMEEVVLPRPVLLHVYE